MTHRPLLVVVGPPASGKTTVGTAVAATLGLPFRDTDADIEDVTGVTVADLFIDPGETHFRVLEEQAVARALAEHGGVLALGGGAVLSDTTRALLVGYGRDGGTVVPLDVDDDLAAAHPRTLTPGPRPPAGGRRAAPCTTGAAAGRPPSTRRRPPRPPAWAPPTGRRG